MFASSPRFAARNLDSVFQCDAGIDRDTALHALQQQVERAWGFLRAAPGGAPRFFAEALLRATPLLPCCVARQPLNAPALNDDLQVALSHYHGEEIQVVMCTLLKQLIEVSAELWDEPHTLGLLQLLTTEREVHG